MDSLFSLGGNFSLVTLIVLVIAVVGFVFVFRDLVRVKDQLRLQESKLRRIRRELITGIITSDMTFAQVEDGRADRGIDLDQLHQRPGGSKGFYDLGSPMEQAKDDIQERDQARVGADKEDEAEGEGSVGKAEIEASAEAKREGSAEKEASGEGEASEQEVDAEEVNQEVLAEEGELEDVQSEVREQEPKVLVEEESQQEEAEEEIRETPVEEVFEVKETRRKPKLVLKKKN